VPGLDSPTVVSPVGSGAFKTIGNVIWSKVGPSRQHVLEDACNCSICRTCAALWCCAGCHRPKWRTLCLPMAADAKDFPPYTTVQRYFYAWRDSGVWQTINHVLLMDVREAAGREASPTAGVIDSQSVKSRRPSPVARAAMRSRR
jgi:transposase